MSRREFLSPEGLRLDGRRPGELRGVTASIGVLPSIDGSAIFELGGTKVLATVQGPREARQKGQISVERATLSVTCHAATFSSVSGERRKQLRQDR